MATVQQCSTPSALELPNLNQVGQPSRLPCACSSQVVADVKLRLQTFCNGPLESLYRLRPLSGASVRSLKRIMHNVLYTVAIQLLRGFPAPAKALSTLQHRVNRKLPNLLLLQQLPPCTIHCLKHQPLLRPRHIQLALHRYMGSGNAHGQSMLGGATTHQCCCKAPCERVPCATEVHNCSRSRRYVLGPHTEPGR